MPETPASTSGTPNTGHHWQPMKLIFLYQMEAANNPPSSARIMYFKAGLQWEINTFVTPLLQYSAARNIVSVVPSPVAHVLTLYPMLTWNTVPDHIFSSHLSLGHPSQIIPSYDTPWWCYDHAKPEISKKSWSYMGLYRRVDGSGGLGVRRSGAQRSRGAEEQRAEEQRSRGAEEQRSRGAEEGAEEQRSRGAEEQRSRGAEEQRSRGAEEQRRSIALWILEEVLATREE
ncbi:hypothetical protein BDR07DRAFT_1377080 [Suillus spraguei]|nr:hypothetical protein BDR07DRAFT_1377080 [Suillus spraguei]